MRLRPPACGPLSTTAMSEICPLSLNLVTQGCVEVCELRTGCNLFPFAPIRLRRRDAIFYAAREEPGESKNTSPQPCCSRHVLYRNGPGVGVHCACGAESSPGHLQVWIRVSTTPLQRAPSVGNGVEINRAWGGVNKCNQDVFHELSAPTDSDSINIWQYRCRTRTLRQSMYLISSTPHAGSDDFDI